MRDNTDRNRTSPFAFTGSKFEFRAIGSSASVSLANTVLSAAVADCLDVIAEAMEKKLKAGSDLKLAVLDVLQKYIIESEPIRYEGNNYSNEWIKEAEKRGLPNIKRTAYALDALMAPKNIEMLIRQKVFSKEELGSHYVTKLEQYVMTLEIEAETLCEVIDTKVIPAAIVYQERLINVIQGLTKMKDMLDVDIPETEVDILRSVTKHIDRLKKGCNKIQKKLTKGLALNDLSEQAKYFADNIVDLLEEVREPADALEVNIADDVWPLPKYSEMLFIL